MIKVAVFNLGKGMYSAFSLNQECPLATVARVRPTTSRGEVERILAMRFHAQRSEWKKLGHVLESLPKRDAWKFIWMQPSVLWEKTKPQTEKVETLVNEPGLTITKKTPLVSPMEKALFDVNEITGNITKEKMVMAEVKDGKFSFTPVTDDIIGVSQIPAYIASHSTGE